MGFRDRSFTPAGVETIGRCPDCESNSDGDFDRKVSEQKYELWAVCSRCKTRWRVGGGTLPTMHVTEGDLAANALLLDECREVEPLPPDYAT
jgi:hypothetical protein